MPINLTEKKRNLARRRVTSATQLVAVLRSLRGENEEAIAADLTFEAAVFDGIEGLEHIDPAVFNAASGAVTALLNAWTDQTPSNQWDKKVMKLIK